MLSLHKIHYLYIVMKTCCKILTLLLSVLVLATTTLQFHHHDCHGTIYFSLLGEKDIVVDAHDGLICATDCHHTIASATNHSPDCKGHNKCSMHLDQTDVSRQSLIQLLLPFISIQCRLEPVLYPINRFVETVSVSYHFLRHLSLIIKSSSIFRAPPFMCL